MTSSPPTATRRQAVIGIMLVGLTFALLTLAGTTPLGIGRAVDEPARVALDERVFSCTGGLGATNTVSSGNLRDGLARPRSVGDVPLRIVAGRDVARGAFAGQQSLAKRSLGWVPCPEPHANWWFAGAGSAEITHDTVLTITNPRPGAAVIDIDVYGELGPVDAPGLHGITVNGGSVRRVDLAKVAPSSGNVAVSVIASRGLVAVTAADRYSPGRLGSLVPEWLPPQPVPAKDLVLAGLPLRAGTSTLALVNPGATAVIAKVQVIGSRGTFSPEGLEPITVPPESVAAVPVSDVVDGSAIAIRVVADGPITGTVRTLSRDDTAFATGVQVLRDSTSFAVPQGSGRLVLSSLGKAGSVEVHGFDAQGRERLTTTEKVGAASSVDVRLGSRIRYVQLVAAQPAVVAGFSFNYKSGMTSAGVSPAIRATRLPAVRPGW